MAMRWSQRQYATLPPLNITTMRITVSVSIVKSLMNHASQFTHDGSPIMRIASRSRDSFSATSARDIDMTG
jgi:hypothetical protein